MIRKRTLTELKLGKQITIDHDDITSNKTNKTKERNKFFNYINKLYELIPEQTREKLNKLLFKITSHQIYIQIQTILRFALNYILRLRNIAPLINYLVNLVDIFVGKIVKKQKITPGQEGYLSNYTKSSVSYGKTVILSMCCFFIIWGFLAPLKSATMIEGQLVHESKKRVLQHHTGGIIKRIYIKDGDIVEQGELLITLDKTKHQAKNDFLTLQLILYRLEQKRLLAERNYKSTLELDADILKKSGNSEVAIYMRNQEELLQARKAAFDGKIAIKESNVQIYSSKLEALTAQKEAVEKQLSITGEELTAYSKLSKKGIISKELVKKYEQHVAELQSRKISILSEISITRSYVSQNEKDIEYDKNNYLVEINRELTKSQDHINTIKAELAINEDELERLDITSPISGIISNVGKYTEDGILPREYPLLEIIPTDDQLVFDARIRVSDIDVFRKGKVVSIRLMPFKSRVVPPIEGNITSISADIIAPRYQGEVAHYKARVEFNKKSLSKILAINSIELYPGMMGSGSVEIESRTFFEYLFEPIKDSFSKAFIEQ